MTPNQGYSERQRAVAVAIGAVDTDGVFRGFKQT
jgi:hypothetical protein